MDTYREEILEHWQNPQNYGEMKGADLVIDQVNPLCGDEVTFFFRLSAEPRRTKHAEQGRPDHSRSVPGSARAHSGSVISNVSFVGKGCAISVASASILSEAIKGRSVRELSKITGKDIFKLLGGPVAPARLRCAFLPLEAIKKLSSG